MNQSASSAQTETRPEHASKDESPGLYVLLISIHGLIRGTNPELGVDADTGGQVTYVLELARALGKHPDVARVDLLTRRIVDDDVDDAYAAPEEKLSEHARLVRIDCGPRRYIRKEKLWSYLESFADEVLQHVRSVGRVPDVVHSHYADAGHVGALLSGYLGVPQVHTGHSLGRVKALRLREKGLSEETIEKRYNMSRRFEAEETALDNAALVIASTRQEVEEQYELYDHYRPDRMRVIPPGVDLSRFHPPGKLRFDPPIRAEVDRFLETPRKPIVLALSRADPRKNVQALVRAYGESPELRDLANLVLVLGNRERIQDLPKETRGVLSELLLLIDELDLHGKVAYPKRHGPDDVPDLYRLAAARRGVFVNPALTEPFGLTLLESAASGLPIVATHDGGPSDILENCRNGRLIDPLDECSIRDALLAILRDRRGWRRLARRGVRGAERHYSWSGHVERYVREVRKLLRGARRGHAAALTTDEKSRLPTVERMVVSDIDNTLLGDREGLRTLSARLREAGSGTGFGIATGRNIDSARQVLSEWKAPAPDVWITSVGAEIHYGPRCVPDSAWERHLDYRWQPDEVRKRLAELPGLELQGPEGQRRHKVSYDVDPELAPSVREIARHLRRSKLTVSLVYSHQAYLDVLPIRCSKGKALRYLAVKWGLPLERFLVAGDSGNDEEMLRGDTLGVVVGNHSDELAHLRDDARIHFADGEHAWGILEGLEHYGFLSSEGDTTRREEVPAAVSVASAGSASLEALRREEEHEEELTR